jgi:hypothetical protein
MPRLDARSTLIFLGLALTACTGTINGMPAGGDDTLADAGMGGNDSGMSAMPGEGAVARGRLWVDAQVPYCQAPNHARDYDADCAMTCTRPDNADWDPFRSDCSGFVSWAWALPAPGRTTGDFAPFTTDLTHTIDGADLMPGDALNNDTHIVLFEAWTTPGSEATFMEEPGCSSATPYAREFTATVTITGDKVVIAHHGTFTAIRYDAAP